MTLEWTTEVGAGAWLNASAAPWEQVVGFGPPGFAGYVRVRYVPDPVRPGQAESDHDLPDDHPSELDQARTALRVLGGFTTTPDACWFAVWDGYPGTVDVPTDLPLLDVPDAATGPPFRRYGLLRGRLADVLDTDAWSAVAGGFEAAPAFVWPSDRRWCFAGDVDPHWAGIGASEAAVAALLQTSGLDVVRADPEETQPHFWS